VLESVGERAGAGVAQDQDPYLRRVSIAADGLWILAGTTVEGGGNALEIDLTTGVVHDRMQGLPPLAIADAGLVLGDGFGFIGTSQGVFRYRRQPGASAQRVRFEPQPAWFSGELVTSPNGLRAITTAGVGPGACTPWTFTLTGPAVQADDLLQPLSP